MADKIASFEDYVKRESRNKDQVPDPAPEEVRQETMEIQIEDPFQFLNEQEREEYLLRRQKEQQKDLQDEESIRQERRDPVQEPVREPENAPRQEPPKKVARDERDYDRERNNARDRDYGRDRDYDEDYNEIEEAEEAAQLKDARIRRAVRIASALTGIIILAFVGLFLKIMVYDRFFAPNPDNVVNVSVAIPEGYTLTNDIVVVKDAGSLNIRSGPGTDSGIVGTVADGTTLKRIAVSENGSWAFIEYDGQYCYASMKYLEPN